MSEAAAAKQSSSASAERTAERPGERQGDNENTSVTRLHSLVGNDAVGQLLRNATDVDARLSLVRAELARGGEPLDETVRADAERELGAELPDVRIHRSPGAAAAVNATAFTVGGDVVLGADVPALESSRGRRVLLHELVHVLQQQRLGPSSLAVVPPGAAAEKQAAAATASGVGAATGGIARLTEKDVTRLSDAELDSEYELTRRWIAEHPSGADHDAGVAYMEEIEQELRKHNSRAGPTTSSDPPAHSDTGSSVPASTTTGGGSSTSPQPAALSAAEVFSNALSRRSWSEAARALAEMTPAERRNELDALTPEARWRLRTASAELDPSPKNPVLAETDAPTTQLTPQMTTFLGVIATELAEVEPLVTRYVREVPTNPADYALNAIRGLAARIEQDRQELAALATLPGSPASVANAVARLEVLKARLAPIVTTAEHWHTEHPAGESLGMWNDRQGVALAGSALKNWEQGGWGYVSGSAAIVGAFGVAFLDAGEKMFSFGFHDAATAVSQAYERGDISWNEGESILRSAAWRALLIAAVTRGAGAATSRLGAAAARGVGLAPEALGFGVAVGTFSGATTSALALGTQALFTSALESHFTSPAGSAIWRQGIPSGTEWAIAIPLGMVFGAAGGVNSVQVRNAGLIGTVVETPAGQMRIRAITPGGDMVLQPVTSTRVPPPPPPSEISLVYDPATDSWGVPRETGTGLKPAPQSGSPSVKADPVKVDPVKVDPVKVDPVNEPVKADPVKADPVKVDPAEVDPAEVDPLEVDPADTDPAELDPAEADPAKVDPAEADPATADPVKTDPAKVDPADAEPVKTDPVKTKPVKVEPVDMTQLGAPTEPPQFLDAADFTKIKLKPGQDALYILRDAEGNMLKVGKTSAAAAKGRFSVYKRAGKLTGKDLRLEVHPLKPSGRNAEFYEAKLRAQMESEGNALPWDNTGGRLGRPGFGTPGEGVRTPPVSKERMTELLKLHKGNLREVGKALGVHRRTADLWAKSYDLRARDFR